MNIQINFLFTHPKANSVMFIMGKYISLSDALLGVENCLVFWPRDYELDDVIREKHVIVEPDVRERITTDFLGAMELWISR